ncbi:MAG TPA: peroxidase-related enzyme [Urbifossiella sp.]|jgi:uncharacterized peroxidase-related enzyme
MAHVQVPEGEPGIIGLMLAFQESREPLNALCNVVMCGESSSLSKAEREMIATYVSSGNECYFCTNSHAAAARQLLGDKAPLMDAVLVDLDTCGVDDKMRALLTIAGKVRRDGRTVTPDDVARARAAGADDRAIHDTVLIAAMFCMFNRYVDGLGTWAPRNPEVYAEIGNRISTKGYGSRYREADKRK